MTGQRNDQAGPWFAQTAAALMLAVALLLAILLIKAPGTGDVGMFLIWGRHGEQFGIIAGYHMMVDNWALTVLGGDGAAGGGEYPPLGVAWLTWVIQLGHLIGLPALLSFKSGLLASGFLATAMLWWMSRSLALAAAFQTAILISASGLGYTDIVTAPLVIGTLWAIRDRRNLLGFFVLLLAILVKWQCLLLAPVLLLHMLDISDRRSVRRALATPLLWQMAVLLLLTAGCVAALFGSAPLQAFRLAFNHPYLSGTTLNAAWLATFLYHILLSPTFSIGNEVDYLMLAPAYLLPFRTIFFILFGVILWRFLRTGRTFHNCVYFSILTVITYGVWNSAVHENHWFVALIPAFVLLIDRETPTTRWICLIVAVMLNVNLFVFYGITGNELIARTVGIDLSVVFSLVYIALWGLLMRYGWLLSTTTAQQPEPPQENRRQRVI